MEAILNKEIILNKTLCRVIGVLAFIILTSGVTWLKFLFGYPFTRLLFMGFTPFIPGDLIKAFIAAILYFRLRPRLKEMF